MLAMGTGCVSVFILRLIRFKSVKPCRKIFDVKVLHVNTQVVQGKSKRFGKAIWVSQKLGKRLWFN